jgi:hypothetical protein
MAHRRSANVVAIDSGSGLANATIQQRLVPVRLFYDFLMEESPRAGGLLVALPARLLGLLNSFRMMRCPVPGPSTAGE